VEIVLNPEHHFIFWANVHLSHADIDFVLLMNDVTYHKLWSRGKENLFLSKLRVVIQLSAAYRIDVEHNVVFWYESRATDLQSCRVRVPLNDFPNFVDVDDVKAGREAVVLDAISYKHVEKSKSFVN